MSNLPSGTVTFLFTDIEGSTKLAQQYPDAMPILLARHHEILKQTIQAQNGYVFQNEGDSLAVAFHSAMDAVNAALSAQRLLQHEAWAPAPIKVRMGIHTGAAQLNDPSAPTIYTGYATLASTQRIVSAGHGGQILLSGATRELIQDALPAKIELLDLGEKRLKDLLRPVHLYQLNIAGLLTTFPPLKTLDSFQNNLPTQLTTFIGREDEIAEVKQELELHRLVTLTGSGGTGKTRLSLQVAAQILDRFKDGVWFIELAPITDPELVPNTVAGILGVREEAGRPLMTTLMDWLSDQELLIILDNCEHLLDACARFTDSVLRGSPETRIMASSREALGIAGETAYRVPSLPTPNPKEQLNLEQLQECDSARLFIERATQTLTTFKVTNATVLPLTQICYRLDGIPLAIELAAARVKVLSIEQIAERLDDRFRLLTGGSRTALPRQQTLRALIDWSYHLLSDQERLLFRRLAVFVGGWTLEAAEAACSGDGIEAIDILDLLAHLVDKSLIIVENAGKESRYHRLETIRQYAREKLFETEEAARMRDRHLDYFRTLAEKAEIEIVNANQVAWLQRLDVEFDNIRAALEWSQEKRVQDGLRLGSAIWRFCLRYGYTNELVEKLNQLLQHPQGILRTLARAKSLYVLSILAVWQSDYVRLRALADESYAIYKEIGDQGGEAAGLYALGLAADRNADPNALSLLLQSLALYRSMNDKTDICDVLIVISQVSREVAQQQACLEEALALARARGDVITMAGALDNLGRIARDLGNFAQARAWLEESLEIQRPLGAPGYVSTLGYLSILALYEGKLTEARAYLDEELALSRQPGMPVMLSHLWTLVNMGFVALHEGNMIEAKEKFNLTIRQFQKANSLIGMVFAIEGLANLHVRQNRPGEAARLLAWSDAMRERINDPRPPVEQAWVERDLAVIHSQINDNEFIRLSVEGRTMTVEQAIALAVEEKT